MPSRAASERSSGGRFIYITKHTYTYASKTDFGGLEGGCLHEVNKRGSEPPEKKERIQQAGSPHVSQSSCPGVRRVEVEQGRRKEGGQREEPDSSGVPGAWWATDSGSLLRARSRAQWNSLESRDERTSPTAEKTSSTIAPAAVASPSASPADARTTGEPWSEAGVAVVADEGGTLSELGESAPDLSRAVGAASASRRVSGSARSVLEGNASGMWAPACAVNGCECVFACVFEEITTQFCPSVC